MLTVSQSKIGVCLQFFWMHRSEDQECVIPIYCSLDFVPRFPVRPVGARALAAAVNSGMLGKRPPPGWFR